MSAETVQSLFVSKALTLANATLSLSGDDARVAMQSSDGEEVFSVSPARGTVHRAAEIVPIPSTSPRTCLSVRHRGEVTLAVDQFGNVQAGSRLRAPRVECENVRVSSSAAVEGPVRVRGNLSCEAGLSVLKDAAFGAHVDAARLSAGGIDIGNGDAIVLRALESSPVVEVGRSLQCAGSVLCESLTSRNTARAGSLVVTGPARITDVLQCDGASVRGMMHVTMSCDVGGSLAVNSGLLVKGGVAMFHRAVANENLHVRGSAYVALEDHPSRALPSFQDRAPGLFVGETMAFNARSGLLRCRAIECTGPSVWMESANGRASFRSTEQGVDVRAEKHVAVVGGEGVRVETEGVLKLRGGERLEVEAPIVQLPGDASLSTDVRTNSLRVSCGTLVVPGATQLVGPVACVSRISAACGMDCAGAAITNVRSPENDADVANAGFVRSQMLRLMAPPAHVVFTQSNTRPVQLKCDGMAQDVFVCVEADDTKPTCALILPASTSCADGTSLTLHVCASMQTSGVMVVCASVTQDRIGARGDRSVKMSLGSSRRFVLNKRAGLWMAAPA